MNQKIVLVTGCNGFIGSLLVNHLLGLGYYKVFGTSKGENRNPNLSPDSYLELDLLDTHIIADSIQNIQPEVIIHTAAISQVDKCEEQPELCQKINVGATNEIVKVSEALKCHLVFFSTDFVFSGVNNWVTLTTEPNPLSVYAKSKLSAEKMVLSLKNKSAIIRPVLVYGYSPVADRPNIFTWVLDSLENEKEINVVSDQIRTPTFVNDVVHLTSIICAQFYSGIFHIGGAQDISVFEFARKIAKQSKKEGNLIVPVSSKSLNGAELRPKNSCMKLEGNEVIELSPMNVHEGIDLAIQQIQDFRA